jgi:hypothetical protein
MKKYSWIFALILALTMAFVFTACPGDPDDTTTKEEEKKPPEVVDPPYVPNPDAVDFTVSFAADGTGGGTATAKTAKILKDGDNNGAIDPGTLTYITGGYQYAYGSGNNTNYGNAVLRFKLNLGDFALADYGKISFDWQATAPVFNNGNSVNSNKRLYLYATDTEAEVTPYVENKDLIVSNINKALSWYDGGQGDAGAPLVNGLTKQSVEMPINYESRLQYLDGEVWFSIYAHAEGGTYQITNLKFWAGKQTAAPTVPGDNAPPQPPTVADVPADFVALALDFSDLLATGNAEVAPDVPATAISLADGKLTVNFTANNERVNFKFSADQLDKIAARGNNDVYVNIDATIKSGTGDSFRYHIGDAAAAANWNNTASLDAFGLADIAVATANKGIKLALGSNPTTAPNNFIFQHRSGDAITVEFSSITIYIADVPKAPAKTLVFADGDVIGHNETVTLIGTSGFQSLKTEGYEWTCVYFKVKFEDGYKLSDYSKIDFKITGLGGTGDDVSGYKGVFIAAYASEDDVLENDDMKAEELISGSTSSGTNGIADLNTEYSRTVDLGVGASSADYSDRIEEIDGNEVWIAFRTAGSSGFGYKVTDIKFY